MRYGPGARVLLASLTVAAVVAVSGCSPDESDPDPGPPTAEPPTVELGFTQIIPLEGTEHVMLRIENLTDAAFDVDSVGIEWPGYPAGEPAAEDATVLAEHTLDLRFDLPAPACGAPVDEPVIGVVETDHGTIRQRLEASGTVYARRLWQTQCDIEAVERAVDISYSRSWRVVGEGADARALGAIVLQRREGDPVIEVEHLDGSVLHDLGLPGPAVLPSGRASGRIPLEILPGNRCDEHARGQATAPFDFLALLRIDDRRGIALTLQVPLAAKDAATEALDLACAARAAG